MFQILIFLDLQLNDKHHDTAIEQLSSSINILYLINAYLNVKIYFYNSNTKKISVIEFNNSKLYIEKLKDILTHSTSTENHVTFAKKLRALISRLNKQKTCKHDVIIITNSNANNNEALTTYNKLISILWEECIAHSLHMFLLGANQVTLDLFKEIITNGTHKGSLQYSNNLFLLKEFFIGVSCSMLGQDNIEIDTIKSDTSSVKYFCTDHKHEIIKSGVMCTLCGALYCEIKGKCTTCNTRITPDLKN